MTVDKTPHRLHRLLPVRMIASWRGDMYLRRARLELSDLQLRDLGLSREDLR